MGRENAHRMARKRPERGGGIALRDSHQSTLMPLFQSVRRAKRWPVVIPVYDGRRCPDCGALVLADKGQELHRAWHEAQADWQEQVREAIRATAAGAGLTVGEAPGG